MGHLSGLVPSISLKSSDRFPFEPFDIENNIMTTRLPKYLTQDELKRFFGAIPSPRDRALFAVIYHYGLRVDEATMLTVEDVDLKNHRIKVRRLKNGPRW